MKITQVTKTGSVPDTPTAVVVDPRPCPGSPGSPGDVSPGDRHHPWWTTGLSESNNDSYQLVASKSVPTIPEASAMKYAVPMATRGRMYATRLRKRRLVQKNGDCSVRSRNVTKRNRKYMVDTFTTLVDMKWRYHIFMFTSAFVITWCGFGAIWYAIAIYHEDHIKKDWANWTMCVINVYDYNSALLYSIETQTTIGYGFRAIQPICHVGIFVIILQSVVGIFVTALMAGIVFAKISRPKGRAQTIMFSEKAAICQRDGEYCLTFRVGDMRKSHIISTSIRALLVRNRLTAEGESIPLCQYPLALETETSKSDSFVFMVWPVTVVHKIDATSPLWDLSAEKLLTEHFEIIVILEGTVESIGMSTQIRTSYIPPEIMWAERLVPLVTFQLNDGHYEIDYKQFHNTTPTLMPDCSAKDWSERRVEGDIQQDQEFPVSFTAPAVRPKLPTSGRPLQALFHRNFDAVVRKRTNGARGRTPEGVRMPSDGSHINRAYLPNYKRSVSQLVQELHNASNFKTLPMSPSESVISEATLFRGEDIRV